MKKRILSYILVSLYIVSLLCVSASAVGMNAETGQNINTTDLNELSVRLAVNSYFTQRLAYLKGEDNEIAAANIPMGNDEAEHKAHLEANNITILDSTVVLDTIECWGNRAFVTATESASFLMDQETIQETIIHTITLYNFEDNALLLQSDAYLENISGFVSCSYIPSNSESPVEQQVLPGGRSCIVDKAATQIGYTAGSDGYTKYGEWYGQITNQYASTSAWCAMFVSWCAHHSNISTSIIPCNWGVSVYRDHFVTRGRYYSSRAYGGTYTPKAGDIFFQYGTPNSPGHVGIVSSVTSSSVWVIDGNNTPQVENREISLTDSSLVAFADPAYATNSHTVSSAWTVNTQYHWHACTVCGLGQFNKGAHVMVWNDVLKRNCCSVCNYDGIAQPAGIVETENS